MNVNRATPVVSLRDAGRLQVAVEDADQSIGNLEDGKITGQPHWDRLALPKGICLEPGEPVVEPALQVFRQIAANDDAIPFPVLLVFGVEFEMRDRGVESKLGHRQARQFAPPEPGQNHRLVDQGSLQAQHFQTISALGG
jgi:hypothetical protein